jgi:hypothetical protein
VTTVPIDAEELEALRAIASIGRRFVAELGGQHHFYAATIQAELERLDAIRARAKQVDSECTCGYGVTQSMGHLRDCRPLHRSKP